MEISDIKKTLQQQMQLLNEAFEKAVEAEEHHKLCIFSEATVKVAYCLLALSRAEEPRPSEKREDP